MEASNVGEELQELLSANTKLYADNFDPSEYILTMIDKGDMNELLETYRGLVETEEATDKVFKHLVDTHPTSMEEMVKLPMAFGVTTAHAETSRRYALCHCCIEKTSKGSESQSRSIVHPHYGVKRSVGQPLHPREDTQDGGEPQRLDLLDSSEDRGRHIPRSSSLVHESHEADGQLGLQRAADWRGQTDQRAA